MNQVFSVVATHGFGATGLAIIAIAEVRPTGFSFHAETGTYGAVYVAIGS